MAIPPPPTLTPAEIYLGVVPLGQNASATFVVTSTTDVAYAITPELMDWTTNLPSSFAFDPASTCQSVSPPCPGVKCSGVLPPCGSCTLIVDFHAMVPGEAIAQVGIAGPEIGVVRARTPGWAIETPSNRPGSWQGMWVVDADHVFTFGGDAIAGRDENGWVVPSFSPVGFGQTVSSVWAPSSSEVYAVGAGTLHHSTAAGKTWISVDTGLTSGATQVVGTTPSNVFVGDSKGEILVGDGTTWSIDKSIDGLPIDRLRLFGGDVYAIQASRLSRRAAPGSWSTVLDVSGTATLASAWGTSPSDFYAVGTKPSPCTVNCGVIFHVAGGSTTSTTPGFNSFADISGDSTGTVYAVGDGGVEQSAGGDVWTKLAVMDVSPVAVGGAGGDLYVLGKQLVLHRL